jgi:hypothetical protein
MNDTTISNFFTWDSFSNITTLTSVIALVVQFTKSYIPIPTQIWTYIITALVLVVGDIQQKNLSNIPMSLINAFIVASLASNSIALVDRLSY